MIIIHGVLSKLTDHFTVVCLVACPLNESEAGGDLVLMETLNFWVTKTNDSSHPDDLFQTWYVTPGFKPFSYKTNEQKQS